jgi:hypothetical protein
MAGVMLCMFWRQITRLYVCLFFRFFPVMWPRGLNPHTINFVIVKQSLQEIECYILSTIHFGFAVWLYI